MKATLIDQYGAVVQRIKELDAIKEKFKKELLSQHSVGTYQGEYFTLEVQHYERASINPILVREFCDDELIRNVTQIRPVDALIVKPLEITI